MMGSTQQMVKWGTEVINRATKCAGSGRRGAGRWRTGYRCPEVYNRTPASALDGGAYDDHRRGRGVPELCQRGKRGEGAMVGDASQQMGLTATHGIPHKY